MPRYELMYILASSISDDQVPEVTQQVVQYVTDFGGTDIQDTQLGKKKLAYPVKKTRNGFYGVVDFTMDSKKINDLDAKIRTQGNVLIRYILVNMEEHLDRTAKDLQVQALMNKNRPEANIPKSELPEAETPAPVATPAEPKKEEAPAAPVVLADIDEQIEAALNEDITK